MHHLVIAQCIKNLKQIETYLNKAEKFAAAKKFDVAVLVNDQLAPDMRNFIYQVQSACDYVKAGAGWLSGQRPPRHEDNEQNIADLRARLQKTIAFAESVTEAQYVGAHDRKIGWPVASRPGEKQLTGDDYLLQIVVPNAFFHITTAYAILGHNGVEVGKRDFLGPLRWIEG
jgi:hypothetical protein